jgi:branched-chain amino acid transport system ATP-binding protein
MKPTTDEAILQVRGLTVRFGSLVAVDGVGFDAQRGHITAVIGPNGAGKSSLFNLISGAIRPSAGQVLLDGRDVTGASPDRMLAAGLSRSFQITNLFFELPVRENLRLAAQFVEAGRGLLRHVSASRAAQQPGRGADRALLAAGSRANELAGFLSHGEQRRLGDRRRAGRPAAAAACSTSRPRA